MTKAEPRYECDCCGRRAPLTRCWYAGSIETYACDECRGVEEDLENDQERYEHETGYSEPEIERSQSRLEALFGRAWLEGKDERQD